MSKQVPEYGNLASGLDRLLAEEGKASEPVNDDVKAGEVESETRTPLGRKTKSPQKTASVKKIKTCLYISSDLQRQLKVFCAQNGIAITVFLSDLIEKTLRKEIKNNKGRITECQNN